jgi:ketosteroid isomerase-like protein
MPDRPGDVAAARTTFERAISHMQRGSYDSVPALLAPDFIFVAEGKRLNGSEFMALIKGVTATEVRIELSNVATHASGDVAYLLYDAKQSLKMGGQSMIVLETGSVVMRRAGDKWNIALWVATSPPPAPTK